MKVLTAEEMGKVDSRTVDEFGVSFAELMENAGAAVARFVDEQYFEATRVVVVCGKGNNGGDGLVAARHLAATGREVSVVLLADPSKLKGEPAEMFRRLEIKPLVVADVAGLERDEVEDALAGAEVIIDAVYGTGFHPPLDPLTETLRKRLATATAKVVAVDLPSGWDADSRQEHMSAVRADAVVTFTSPKLAHLFSDLTAGPVVVAEIGSPEAAIVSATRFNWTGSTKAKFEAPRPRNSNKGMYGHVVVIGGARGKAGAPSMSSLAALRVGAGLVTAAVSAAILPMVARIAPELMTEPLEETADGGIALGNASPERLEMLLDKVSVLAVGPGLGQDKETQQFVHALVANSEVPLVLDADGLNAYAGHAEKLHGGKRTLVLTPHPGEMARLLGTTVKEVEADRENIARKFATEHELILVLKGWRTLVAHPDGRVSVNTSGNPGLAKGGSGDVLTGFVAGMLAQAKAYGASAGEAVDAAVYLHGLASDLTVEHGDEHTLLITDIFEWLPEAFQFRSASDQGFAWLQGFPLRLQR
jgi:ADP-dependent NAD(P)H-hydrate dehydratase / NAD(P)H-hydrate epimerase